MSANDQRKKEDRRKVNLGPPPGCEERRKNPDRRVGHTHEVELSEEEWKAYFGTVPKQGAPDGAGDAGQDSPASGHAADSDPEGR